MLSSACKLAGGTSFALCKVFILTINMLEGVVSHLQYKGSHPVVNQSPGSVYKVPSPHPSSPPPRESVSERTRPP